MVLLPLAFGVSCRNAPEQPSASSTSPVADGHAAAPASQNEWFIDATQETGLDFVHVNGMSGEYHLPEIMPPGVAFLDYDNDGDLDAYLVQGKALEPGRTSLPNTTPGSGRGLKGRLFKNDLTRSTGGSHELRFTDVTDHSGIEATGFGMGVAAGDVDNDGRIDLYVANYVHYRVGKETKCRVLAGGFDYCPPQAFRAQASRLYRNNRDGTFSDVTAAAGMAGKIGPALGISTADFDNDGWIDIYVAIDGEDNQLWMNQRNGTFRNTALVAGAALSELGKPEASMGVDAGDFDNDGHEDLFMTHLEGQGNNLYVNLGSGTFDDRSASSGLGPSSLPYTGFGAAWFDFDNDGRLDLATVNGTILAIEGRKNQFPYDQVRQLFRNLWLGLKLLGEHTPRDMLGARVTVSRRDGSMLWRHARADGSYASANDPRVLVGLGSSADSPRVRVRWPGGRTESGPKSPSIDGRPFEKGVAGEIVRDGSEATPQTA